MCGTRAPTSRVGGGGPCWGAQKPPSHQGGRSPATSGGILHKATTMLLALLPASHELIFHPKKDIPSLTSTSSTGIFYSLQLKEREGAGWAQATSTLWWHLCDHPACARLERAGEQNRQLGVLVPSPSLSPPAHPCGDVPEPALRSCVILGCSCGTGSPAWWEEFRREWRHLPHPGRGPGAPAALAALTHPPRDGTFEVCEALAPLAPSRPGCRAPRPPPGQERPARGWPRARLPWGQGTHLGGLRFCPAQHFQRRQEFPHGAWRGVKPAASAPPAAASSRSRRGLKGAVVRPGSDVTGGLPWPPVTPHNHSGAKPTNWGSELVAPPVLLVLLGKAAALHRGGEAPPRDASQKGGVVPRGGTAEPRVPTLGAAAPCPRGVPELLPAWLGAPSCPSEGTAARGRGWGCRPRQTLW